MINNNSIEKYKKAIEDLYKIMKFNPKEEFDINVKKMLDNDLKINKISEEEYNYLITYFERFVKIEKYKQEIRNIYDKMTSEGKEDVTDIVKKMLDNYMLENRISEDEKELLNNFLKELSQKDINSNIENTYRVEELSPITMYKGEIGRRAPTREERKDQIRQESEVIRDEMKKEREGR